MKIRQLQWFILLCWIGTLAGCAEFQDEISPDNDGTTSSGGNNDTESDSDTDAGTDSETESYSDEDSETGSKSDVDTETYSDTDSNTDEDFDAGVDSGTDSDSEEDSDTGSDSDMDSGVDTETESEIDTQPPDTNITIQEGMVGFCGVEGTIDTNHDNYTGAGFANADNNTESGITWRVNLEAADTDVHFTWRYAYEYITPDMQRDATLRVDDKVVVATISFPVTASWDTWEDASASADLSAGEHKVELVGKTTDGLANIDCLTVSNAPVSAVSCSK
jgi:hypothetical protein